MMGKKPLLLKEIPILPSEFKVDVIICSDIKQIAKLAHKRYGETERWYEENLTINSCCAIYSKTKSDLKGHLRIVVILKNKSKDVLVHELIHALWYSAKYIGYEMKFKTQEWQAVLYEYLYKEAVKNDYQKIAWQ